MKNRPLLEILSWVAGIAAFILSVFVYFKSQPDVTTTPQSLMILSPSFDCIKATQNAERLVCNSADLALLDLTMANLYRDLQASYKNLSGDSFAQLKVKQNNWLRSIRNGCEDIPCLKSVYSQRISELRYSSQLLLQFK